MARNYYYLVSSLVEYAPDSDTKGLDIPELREEIAGQLSDKDRGYLREFYTFYDIQNLSNVLNNRPGQFSSLGNLSAAQIARVAETLSSQHVPNEDEQQEYDDIPMPDYLDEVITQYKKYLAGETDEDRELTIDPERSLELNLWTAYYNHVERSKCSFLRNWYSFDRDLRNISAAYAARTLNRNIAPQLVGEGTVVEALSHNNANDFGLRNEVSYLEAVTQILNLTDMVEKERQMDNLRWQMVDELTDFDYFNINRILGYLVKLNIIYRWMSLDEAYGRQMLGELVKELTKNDVLESFDR